MKIQLDIPKELNKKLKIEKATKEYVSIAQTIIIILGDYFNGKEKTY